MSVKPKNISHAVYNNNPGNIKYSVDGKKLDYLKVLDRLGIKYSKGSEASDGGYFIKFENHEDGYKAAKAWWPTVKSWSVYEGLTLDEALKKYSGDGYDSKKLGLDLDGSKPLSEFSDEELGAVMTYQIKMEDPKEYTILQDKGLLVEGETYVDPEEAKGEGRQTQIVYDANGNPVEIEIGEDVTEYELREKQTGGEQRFKNWKELQDNIDKFDKSRPFYIGENRYKWNEEKQKVLLVDEKGEYLPDDRQRENEQFQDIFKGDRVEVEGGTLEGRSPKEMVEDSIINPPVESATEEVVEEEPIIGAEQKPDVGLDIDNDGIPDTIDIDGGEGTNIPISATQDVEQEPKKRTTGEMINQAVNTVGSVGESILGGAGKVLDALGGPSAIISYVMGKKGLEAAMKEVTPMESPQLSPLFHQHLRQSKELAKRGFHPKEAQQFRSQLDNAYQRGIENAVRGSAGQRARFLAQSGVLDSQRSSALLDFAAKDAELQRKNQETYTDQMLFKENFDLQRSDKLRTEDMQRQLADKEAASKFTATAFSNLMNGIGGVNTALIKQMLKSFQGGTGSTDLSSGL